MKNTAYTCGIKKAYAVLIVLCTSLAAFAIAFCYFKTIKELYFSKTICREDVEQRQDLESKRRIVKLLSSNSGHWLLCLLYSICDRRVCNSA